MTIPVTLIGGYLGAGKTTLVNHLLRERDGRRIAVLVNDFGALPIDDALIESRDGPLLQLAGGCICCSFGSDLMAALQQMLALQPQPGRILIETSGVALPAAVARTLGLLRGLRLDAVLVLADAETVRERAADRYVGELVCRQLAEADVIVLNKCDLVTPAQTDALCSWLSGMAGTSRVLPCRHARIAPALLWQDHDRHRPGARADTLAADTFDSLSLEFAHKVQVQRLADALAAPSLALLRAKGLMLDADAVPYALHVVGRRAGIEALAQAPPCGRLVCIALRGQLQAERVRAALAACAV